MTFVHENAEFRDLLEIVSRKRRLDVGLIEKDYWVTHTLWALHHQGFAIWFKGGTSLSKGFGLIERFSEDLDLKIEAGSVKDIPSVSNWKSEGKNAIAERKAFFASLLKHISVPGADVQLDETFEDQSFRSTQFRVVYPGRHLDTLHPVFKPFVLLEIGSARVVPFVKKDMTSFVHQYLEESETMRGFEDNRPKAVRCIHPLVTLIEKLDALQRRVPREDVEPATFIRHYEDAARIIRDRRKLPSLEGYSGVRALADEMLSNRQIAALPAAEDPAFTLNDANRRAEMEKAHEAITPIFWGKRIQLNECCEIVREYLKEMA